MTKLIRTLAKSAEEQQQQQLAHRDPNNPYGPLLGPDGMSLPEHEQHPQPLDPSKLDFCRGLYDYPPPSSPPSSGAQELELSVKKGDLVAVLSKTDPMGNSSEWWRCRARDGRMGWLPGVYLEVVQRRPQATQRQITEKGEEGRASTMSTLGGGGESRNNSLTKEKERDKVPVPVSVKIGEKGGGSEVEGYQRGGYYS